MITRRRARRERDRTSDADEARLEQAVRERVDAGRSTGMAAGILHPDGTTAFSAHGDGGEGRMIDDGSLFEIGSITKVFTATLLAEMAQRGEVGLEDPVASLLPSDVRVPSRGGRQITLVDLATHASGLPRMPAVADPADPADPFAGLTVEQLYASLAACEPARDPGALRSTAADMLRFAAANLNAGAGPLHAAMAVAQVPRRRMGLVMRMGLCWWTLGSKDRRIVFHDGDTMGFSSALALRPARGTAVVVLSNSARSGVGDISLHVLEPRLPLLPAPPQPTAMELAPEMLDRYVGSYDVAGTAVPLTRSEHGLDVRVPGSPVDTLVPESKTAFFSQKTGLRVEFKIGLRRTVTGAVVQIREGAPKMAVPRIG